MGSDAAGNRYYENRVDYPFGMHRWVEPGDIHNFDSTSVPPEWQGWMVSQNDEPPCAENSFIEEKSKHIIQLCHSDAPEKTNVGYQEPMFHFHNLHNQTQVRSRGYGIGNHVVGLPPHVKDSYYTQPGSPYNEASIKPLTFMGDLDETKGGGRPYKSEKWAERLRTQEEKKQLELNKDKESRETLDELAQLLASRKKLAAIQSRGSASTVVGGM